jgi:hypothetical protein
MGPVKWGLTFKAGRDIKGPSDTETDTVTIDKQTNAFIQRVTNTKTLSAYNFLASDFQTLTHKNSIRGLFEMHLGKIRYSESINSSTVQNLNKQIDSMKSKDSAEFFRLFNLLKEKNIGPGEVLLFHLINDLVLSSTGASYDAQSGNNKIEMKSVKIRQNTSDLYGFRIGSSQETRNILEVMLGLIDMARENKIIGKNDRDISTNKIVELKEIDSKKFESLRRKFARVVMSYLNEKTLVAFNNQTGHILVLGDKIKESDIGFYEVTQGTLKPTIKYRERP